MINVLFGIFLFGVFIVMYVSTIQLIVEGLDKRLTKQIDKRFDELYIKLKNEIIKLQ